MIEHSGQQTSITCDKCGMKEVATPTTYNQVCRDEGWAMNPRAKKYVHLCRFCQTPKQRKARDFVERLLGTRP